MSLLRIYFSAQWRDATSPCQWSLGDESGAVLQSGTAPLSSLPQADDYLAIIAADRVTCVAVHAPIKARRRWEAALPLIAEEFSLAEPEQNHVVPGAPQADGTRPLAIIDLAWLSSIVAACRAANRPLRRALPEFFLAPLSASAWTLVWDGQCGFLRTGEASGMVMDNGDTQNPPLSLKLSLLSQQPQNIEVRFPAGLTEQALPNWIGLPVELLSGLSWDWRSAAIEKKTLNLLWGKLAPRLKVQEWLPKLRAPLLIAVAALTLEAVATNIEWWRLSGEKHSLTQQMERSFRGAFGEGSVVVDPALQMQRNLAALHHAAGMADESDFLSLLDGSASALTALPSGSVRALHYEAGRLDVNVHIGSAKELGELQQRLQRSGFGVSNGDTHNSADGIDTRLTLQREGAQ